MPRCNYCNLFVFNKLEFTLIHKNPIIWFLSKKLEFFSKITTHLSLFPLCDLSLFESFKDRFLELGIDLSTVFFGLIQIIQSFLILFDLEIKSGKVVVRIPV